MYSVTPSQYLGLEVTELTEKDMPFFIDGNNHSSTTNEIK